MNLVDVAAQKLGVKPVVNSEKAEKGVLIPGGNGNRYDAGDFTEAFFRKASDYLEKVDDKFQESHVKHEAPEEVDALHKAVHDRYRFGYEESVRGGKISQAAQMDALDHATQPLKEFVHWLNLADLSIPTNRARAQEKAKLLSNGKF